VRFSLLLVGAFCAAVLLLGPAAGGTFSGGNGSIAYTCGSDVCQIESDGSNRTVVQTSGSDPSWAQDGTVFAFVAADGIHVDGALLPGTLGGTQPTFSDDSESVTFVNGGDLYTSPADTSAGPTQLTFAGKDFDPAYSPDGTKIAFASTRGGSSYDIWVLTIATSTVAQVTSSVGDERNPTWSPTGATIVYNSSSNGHLFSVASSGGTPVDLGVTGTEPTYAPDGTKIAFVDAAQLKVMVAQQNGTVTAIPNSAGGTQPDWQRVTPSSSGGGSSSGPTNSAYPRISLASGDSAPVVGHLLTASVGTWSGTFPITYTYQWKRCDAADPVNGACVAIPNATSSAYTPTAADFQKRLRVGVTARDSNGSTEQNSEVTDRVIAIGPYNTASPRLSGEPNAVVDTTITVTNGTWVGSTPLAFTYSWRRCNPVGDLATCTPIIGATATTYTPTIADIGFSLRVWVTASNFAGVEAAFTNHTFPVVDKPHFAPSVQTAPTIAGTALPGRQLTANIGTYGGDAPVATPFRWYRCDATGEDCHVVKGATKVTYEPTANDVGYTLRLFVFASNAYGKLLAKSAPTIAVAATPPSVPGRRIVGTAKGDYLAGGGHDDTILGRKGNDTILGGAGYDKLSGEQGNDVITGGSGADRIDGGPGSDSIDSVDDEQDTIECGDGNDKVTADTVDKVAASCEVVERPSAKP
jgi:WD40-like Beta Propeller Repeat/RTX calcium-binding nonapeptide repeat (4 copies)